MGRGSTDAPAWPQLESNANLFHLIAQTHSEWTSVICRVPAYCRERRDSGPHAAASAELRPRADPRRQGFPNTSGRRPSRNCGKSCPPSAARYCPVLSRIGDALEISKPHSSRYSAQLCGPKRSLYRFANGGRQADFGVSLASIGPATHHSRSIQDIRCPQSDAAQTPEPRLPNRSCHSTGGNRSPDHP